MIGSDGSDQLPVELFDRLHLRVVIEERALTISWVLQDRPKQRAVDLPSPGEANNDDPDSDSPDRQVVTIPFDFASRKR